MICAGTTEGSLLVVVMMISGWAMAIATPAVLILPGEYREIASAFLPTDDEENLPGWRSIGILGSAGRLTLIYFGALAL